MVIINIKIARKNRERIKKLKAKGFKIIKTKTGATKVSFSKTAALRRVARVRKEARPRIKIVPFKVVVGKRIGKKAFAFAVKKVTRRSK